MQFPADVPTLTDGVVVLRAHELGDIEGVVEQCNDPESIRWTTVPVPYGRADAQQFVGEMVPDGWRDATSYSWAIETADDTGSPRFAGSIDLRPNGAGAAEIGFGLHPAARGRHVMRRAVRLALDWGFADAGFAVVHWHAQVGNWASRRVAWRLGFRMEGTVRKMLAQRGELRDCWVGSVLPTDSAEPVTRWFDVATLVGEDVVLREFTDSDADRVAEACSDERTQHWLAGLPAPYTRLNALDYIARRRELHANGAGIWWCIADPATDVCLGNISVMQLDGLDPTSGEIGYWAHPGARGRGVMTEAVRLVVRHAFAPPDAGGLELRRLSLFCAAGNPASAYVAKQAGFVHTGTQRAAEPLGDGTYDDLLAFDVLADVDR
ncbi:MAG TPA: GNAT family N-acetyltransferase [Nocardioidaceae bacterium]|nr:GNAT family N-acetyltransferase [Nocardioidaceae bacterium]